MWVHCHSTRQLYIYYTLLCKALQWYICLTFCVSSDIFSSPTQKFRFSVLVMCDANRKIEYHKTSCTAESFQRFVHDSSLHIHDRNNKIHTRKSIIQIKNKKRLKAGSKQASAKMNSTASSIGTILEVLHTKLEALNKDIESDADGKKEYED